LGGIKASPPNTGLFIPRANQMGAPKKKKTKPYCRRNPFFRCLFFGVGAQLLFLVTFLFCSVFPPNPQPRAERGKTKKTKKGAGKTASQ